MKFYGIYVFYSVYLVMILPWVYNGTLSNYVCYILMILRCFTMVPYGNYGCYTLDRDIGFNVVIISIIMLLVVNI